MAKSKSKLRHRGKLKEGLRYQKPLKGGRVRWRGFYDPDILEAAERLAYRFGCTVPMVLSTALADTVGLDVDERFNQPPAKKNGHRRK